LLGANPTTLGFGNITLNSNSSLAVTLTNNGNSKVTISGVTVTGFGFSTSGVTSGLTLQPTQTATLNVAFTPTAAGAAAGSLTVTSNASNSPATISLTGSSYSVNLTWQPSPSNDVAGYNVFRGTSSGSYTQLNTSPITGTAYTDSAVVDNQTYFYVVTTVSTNAVQSANSNQTSVSIP
jgi:Abnormal spindle-like microcephaly-assoc'd, ASPM-SPD-2-Hydin